VGAEPSYGFEHSVLQDKLGMFIIPKGLKKDGLGTGSIFIFHTSCNTLLRTMEKLYPLKLATSAMTGLERQSLATTPPKLLCMSYYSCAESEVITEIPFHGVAMDQYL
jgi:hypothetical protein